MAAADFMKHIPTISLTLLFISACAALPPGRYGYSDRYVYKEIDLRQDHTFTYEAGTDSGGVTWIAEGTWRWTGDNHEEIETTVKSRSGDGDKGEGYLPDQVIWNVNGSRLGSLPRL